MDAICEEYFEGLCNDYSEVICKSSYSQGCNETVMYKCAENQTCVHQSLVCDGRPHCPDASDESEALCSQCPRSFGFPVDKLSSATFSCRHRYTGRRICAVPCDGHDDLCLDFEDENCDPGSNPFLFAIVAVFLILTVLLGEVFYRLRESWTEVPTSNFNLSKILLTSDESEPTLQSLVSQAVLSKMISRNSRMDFSRVSN